MEILYIVIFLQIKHLLLDWIFQPKWMWSNKGTYGHLGGVTHALLNGFGTAAIISLYYNNFWPILVIDSILHYHIDWAKIRILNLANLDSNDKEFWWLTGIDQFLHQITYILLIMMVI